MSQTQIAVLVLAAVGVFWALGAYNRLVSMRTAVGQAWARVDEARRQRADAAHALLAALHEPLAAEHGALDALRAALSDSERAAAALTARPLLAANASAWSGAEAVLASTSARVFALVELESRLAGLPAIGVGTAGWQDAGQRLAFARQVYNEAAQAYNDAIAMFPTRLLVRGFGFESAGRL